MTTVTPDEITQAHSGLAGDPNAIAALKVIEECEENLEDAFEVLMVQLPRLTPLRLPASLG